MQLPFASCDSRPGQKCTSLIFNAQLPMNNKTEKALHCLRPMDAASAFMRPFTASFSIIPFLRFYNIWLLYSSKIILTSKRLVMCLALSLISET